MGGSSNTTMMHIMSRARAGRALGGPLDKQSSHRTLHSGLGHGHKPGVTWEHINEQIIFAQGTSCGLAQPWLWLAGSQCVGRLVHRGHASHGFVLQLLTLAQPVCTLQSRICDAYTWPSAPGLQAPKPSAGPHKQRECLPLLLILRNRLK